MNEVKFIKYCSFAITRKIWELWILYSYHTAYTSWRSHQTGSTTIVVTKSVLQKITHTHTLLLW